MAPLGLCDVTKEFPADIGVRNCGPLEVEPTGTEVAVCPSASDVACLAGVKGRLGLHVAVRVETLCDLTQAHFFDPQSEGALR